MKGCEDNQFDIAIVDPPYGLNFGNFNRTNKDEYGNRFKANRYHNTDWDKSIPDDEYFEQLFRVSKNQIIWGGNYFPLPPTQCFVFWYKQNPVPNFSDGELAWTSFKKPAVCFDYRYYGNLQGKSSAETKIHPTQKPRELYDFLLHKFAQPGMKILDTHLGSGSIGIACHYFGCELYATEINEVYYHNAMKRIKDKTVQIDMFNGTQSS
jgi:site-specific DNA-methyltransferase (adenine-specific)